MQAGDLLDDRYRLEAPLGKGGMGEVWRARDVSQDRDVAVKLLLPTVRDVVDMARFQREAELAAKVGRAGGVVRVHAFGNWRGSPYCVQELIEGGSLKEVFAQDPDPERVAELVEQVARGLALCHAEGVIHRDLKPDNILLTPDGRPKLADFGLAKQLDGSDEERLTRSAEVLGTPAYMAPEQADPSVGPRDHRSDIYSLGAILYHGLTGRRPFASTGGLLALLTRIVKEAPTSPHSLNPRVYPGLEAVCLKAMEKRPDDRYPTAEAFAADLEAARTGGVPTALADRPAVRKRVLLFAVLALVGAFAAAFGATEVSRRTAAQARTDRAAALAKTLDPWLSDLGRKPAPVELGVLRPAAAHLPPEAQALRFKLNACARLMLFRRGDTTGNAGENAYGQLVEAVILGEGSKLRSAQAALDRAVRMGVSSELAEGVRRWLAGRGFLAVVERSGSYTALDSLKRDLEEAMGGLSSRELEALKAAKLAALVAGLPSWRAEVARLERGRVPSSGVAFLDRLQLVLRVGVACPLPPEVGSLLDRVGRAFPAPRIEGRHDAQVALKRLTVQLAIYDLDPRPVRATPAGWGLLTSAIINQYPKLAHDGRFLLALLRAGLRPKAPWLFGDRTREIPERQLRELEARHRGSAALAYLRFLRRQAARPPDTLEVFEEFTALLRRVIEASFPDLHPIYLSDAMAERSHALAGTVVRAPTRALRPEIVRWAQSALKTAGEDRWAAHRALDRFYWSVFNTAGRVPAWELVKGYEAFFQVEKGVKNYFLQVAWNRYLGLAGMAGNNAHRYAEVERILKDRLPPQPVAGHDHFMKIRTALAHALLSQKKTAAAAEVLDSTWKVHTDDPMQVAVRAWALRLLKRYDEAWAALEVGLARYPEDTTLLGQRGELMKVAPRDGR